ncbi:uncharacterized protein LOC143041063 isoform X4 [Oratosquilla oratoria]|uniref:uncharacterized protein LOC143041063 isoform X4 n=1 Tax=Oratosquilla oratoria TaxID=337810 RepID=UPI003F757278
MTSGLLSLKWNNHRSTFFHVLSSVRTKETYSDVTLACDGKFYQAHKLVLSTCSDYFEQMFEKTQCKQPVIVLKDIRHEELEALLNYMYIGEVNVLQQELPGLIKAAECLCIKGLAVPDEAPTCKETKDSRRTSKDGGSSPQPKRRRRESSPSSSSHHTSGKSHSSNSHTQKTSETQRNQFTQPSTSPHQSRTPSAPVTSPAPEGDGSTEKRPYSGSNTREQDSNANEDRDQTHEPLEVIIQDAPAVKQEIEEPKHESEDVLDMPDSESNLSFDPNNVDPKGGLPADGTAGSTFNLPGFNSQSSQSVSQPQTMEELLAQAIPGSAGIQGDSLHSWSGAGDMPGSYSLESYGAETSGGQAASHLVLGGAAGGGGGGEEERTQQHLHQAFRSIFQQGARPSAAAASEYRPRHIDPRQYYEEAHSQLLASIPVIRHQDRRRTSAGVLQERSGSSISLPANNEAFRDRIRSISSQLQSERACSTLDDAMHGEDSASYRQRGDLSRLANFTDRFFLKRPPRGDFD